MAIVPPAAASLRAPQSTDVNLQLMSRVADLETRLAQLEKVLKVGLSGDVTIRATTVTMKASSAMSLESGAAVTVKASSAMNIESGASMQLKSAIIRLN